MDKTAPGAMMEKVFLRGDNGSELFFRGRLFSETSYYDEETSTLTRMRLFVADGGKLVYSIISGSGTEKTRRHYSVIPEGNLCRMSDGIQTLVLPADMLFAAVFGLCGIDPARAEDLRPSFEENLRMAMG